jgi:hypothetical protein
MANLIKELSFRHLSPAALESEELLEQQGYYFGFPCPHGHTIRDKEKHWCYHCVRRIQSNLCGFDLNYLNPFYKTKYHQLWARVQIGSFTDCWPVLAPGTGAPKRICMPSYRSAFSKQQAENITVMKAIYQCCWGDVGSLTVSRICGNNRCCNPLHMVTSWNRLLPPHHLTPFETTFIAERLLHYEKLRLDGIDPNLVAEKQYKNTILHSLETKIAPKYDED